MKINEIIHGRVMLYHGTSLVQFENMRKANFVVQNIYLGDSRENITDHYAEQKATEDDSYPVTLFIDARALQQLRPDIHFYTDEDRLQIGQFLYSGSLQPALTKAIANDYIETGDDIPLPLDLGQPLPLPLHPNI